MRILLIGRGGQIAWELRRTLACLGEVHAIDRWSTPIAVDLENSNSIQSAIRSIKPNLIVNAAAYTAVDKAEQAFDLAKQINGVAPGVIAESAAEIGAGMIHYSTDYVFPGNAKVPYIENDKTGPINNYGLSKLQGEQAIEQVGIPHFIIRTAWVYGRRRQNFLLTMLRLLKERQELTVVNDQTGSPTWCRSIAICSALMIAKCQPDGYFRPEDRSGVYHVSNGEEASWYEFAGAIKDTSRKLGLLPDGSAKIYPVSSADFPTPAKRPSFSLLCNDRLYNLFGFRLCSWRQSLLQCLEDVVTL